ncbi:MAG: NADH-quinone oxidoreductase subunit J [Gemmatimonas sp.]|jgi:NADH-quinone oxidoreductase subunit J|uniref:NADH-quinone oxidoreductase subunit J n=1 Tax=Gemmatimonas sp. TaxID=1962908 RepID=UPI00391F0E3C|nr:NADH-quinone oxidoreductase subunit J [Gemmatimonadota bacterium]
MNGFYEFQFYLFSLLAIASALLFVTRKNPVPAALWLVNVMFALAGLYVMLDAPFVGAVQVLVYAGAIMVVFVFVVMLLNLGRDGVTDLRSLASRLGAGIVGLALLATLLVTQRQRLPRLESAPVAENVVAPVAASLFTEYLVAFELTSIVLLVAVVGAVLLAKKRVQP